MIKRFGATRVGVWTIKHLIAPLDQWLYRRTGGKIVAPGKPSGPILLLTTTGRRTGRLRTTPIFFLRDGNRLITCNVNPGSEGTNPWVLNLRAAPAATVQVEADSFTCQAREADAAEIELYWPQLTRLWPAYQSHYERSGQRAIFLLENLCKLP